MTRLTLAEIVDIRLRVAGLEQDPALAWLARWNLAAVTRGRYSIETRRGQFGKSRPATLEPGGDCGWPTCPDHAPGRQDDG